MKNRKGFTLIELLAVIVILGLLMAIAIPSVTKYITQSRKKTVTSTIGNYISALVNDVNDLSYTFTASNTVYAVPIECIALERGGTNPFGAWHQASNAYWAYVLVQYDDQTSSYTYGYTFKDSAGYGIYPTTQAKLNEQGKQIQTGLSLSRPKSGKVTDITAVENWSGFNIDSSTDLVVLNAESEGNVGDGVNTCTLQQKGTNYEQVEEEKNKIIQEAENNYIKETIAYAIFSEDSKTLTFVRSKNQISVGDNIDGIDVDAVFSGFENKKYGYNGVPWHSLKDNILRVVVKDKIRPTNTVYWFKDFNNCEYVDVTKLDTVNVTDISYMFYGVGSNVNNVRLIGLETWSTSKVENMQLLFSGIGENAANLTIGDLSQWDTSNVTNMYGMFQRAGYKATNFDVGNLKDWDVSSVKNMNSMFFSAGMSATNWYIGDLSEWDVSNVEDMTWMFGYAARDKASTFDIGNLKKWDVSKVRNMNSMFLQTGYYCKTFYIGDLSGWDTSNVQDMYRMFHTAGKSSSTWSLDCSKWNVENVTSYAEFNYNNLKVTPPNWVN